MKTVLVDRGNVRAQWIDGTDEKLKTTATYVQVSIDTDWEGPASWRMTVKDAEDLAKVIAEVMQVVKR